MRQLIDKYNAGEPLDLVEISSLIVHYSAITELLSKHTNFDVEYIKCLRDLDILLKMEKDANQRILQHSQHNG